MGKEKIVELQKRVFEAYTRKTPKSKQMYARACQTLAGGVTGNLRLYQPYPLYMTHGVGSKTYDVDQNEYVDCFLGNGPLLLGHQHPEVIEGMKQHMSQGSLIFNPGLIIECAELLKEIVPCAEKVRFLNTGTEAVLVAIRIARAFTGKKKIIKFYGHYHGQDDQFLIGQGLINEVISEGIPRESLVNTILLKYNDIDAVRYMLAEDAGIAAIILDPGMHAGGIWPPSREYLKELRKLTAERGIVLIFDEVVTGFRLALGGAQEYYGVTPDMATFAKAIAAGEKLSAVVGKSEIMNVVVPEQPDTSGGASKGVFQSGTMNDGTLALAAAKAAMSVYKRLKKDGEYQKLHQRCERLKLEIEAVFEERGIGCHINNLGPIFKMFLTNLEPSFDRYCNIDKKMLSLFLMSLITEGGCFTNLSGIMYFSFVHTEDDLQKIVSVANFILDKYDFQKAWVGYPNNETTKPNKKVELRK